jgi:hypothetical protein
LLSRPRQGLSITGIFHTGFDDADLDAHEVMINMAYDPRNLRESYEPALDFER